MEAKIIQINEQLKNLSLKMDTIYTKQNKVAQSEDIISSIFYQKRQLLTELNETWQTGRVNAQIQELDMEFKQDQQAIFHEFEKEANYMKNEKYRLEEKESELLSDRRRLTE